MLEWSDWPHCVCPEFPELKEYSRLKMRPGGPPALRTPNHMDGVRGLSPAQLQKVRDSREIGVGVLEQPPSSLAWLETANFELFQEFQGHLAWVDACRHGKCFASNSALKSALCHRTPVDSRC